MPRTIDLAEKITQLRSQGFAATVDILGEAAVSEKEAKSYQQQHVSLLEKLTQAEQSWQSLGSTDGSFDWGQAPRVNLSIKPTSLFSQADPKDFDNTVSALFDRFEPIIELAKNNKAFVNIDEEMLMDSMITTIPKERFVIELLEDIKITDPLIQRIIDIFLSALINCFFKNHI